ncbi:BadF/BadG/BcrA/BcrD ATPase family protein [Actinacidiphila alni]|uniref:BadF/BadG/BcrA/BcrD ATPase family protein n=1 Tax=Actinacidiphila alni TaxID=380248 RepID=A0A1I2HNT4_9ACTN|nr:BadF/BadG/BcrA/BcrD ATPase family protein [Actinacidiphila alni]SFF30960.1 BadF/BadG/BcrA/BcrD ATPase family protein [Actinacidiphila alni]
MRVVVGADVGGTKLAVRVAPLGARPGVEPGTGQAGDQDPEYTDHLLAADGWEASPVDTAAGWLLERLARVVPEGAEIAAVGIGAQGCDTQHHCAELAAAVEKSGVPAVVVNDAALLVPAAGLDTGIGVVAGTGSIAVAADAGGDVLFAGGWGWVLGDEGGAPAIVRDAVRAALAAYDAGSADDGLLAALLGHFAAPDPQTLARIVNDEPTPGNWGPAAPAVFRAADAGSALAAGVIEGAARELEMLVGRLVGRGAVGDTVVAAGSVVVRQSRLADAFRARLAATQPRLTLRLLDVPPVAGALALARARLRTS